MGMFIKTNDTWSNRIRWCAVKFKARLGRGLGWFDFIKWVFFYPNAALLGLDVMLQRWWGITIAAGTMRELSMVLPVVCIIGGYFLGWIDELRGFWKHENVYNQRDLNPFMGGIGEDIKTIKDTIKK